jgi:1,2-diacylglycerol 3-alpha-glucosyltransferase
MFTDSFLPNTDGVVSSILSYRKGMSKGGHRMFVFAPQAAKHNHESGVFRFRSVQFPPYPEYRAAVFPHVSSSIASELKLDLVHSKAMMTMGISAAWFAKKVGLPSMASLETLVPEGAHYVIPIRHAQGLGKAAAWAYLRWLYCQFDLVTSPSSYAQSLMRSHGIESIVLPSPIDTQRFRPASAAKAKESLGLTGKKVVLSIGRIVKEKNYSLLVQAAANMKGRNCIFVIAGKGPHLHALQSEVAANNLQAAFRFPGFVPDSKLPDYYNAADVFAFPSHFETQGLTHLEAMACGKPACVLEGTPMAEVISPGKNGQLFSGEPTDCADKLLSCLSRSEKMSSAARKTALGFSIPKCTKRLVAVYKKLLR